MKQFVNCVSSFFLVTREQGNVEYKQREVCIDTNKQT